MCSGQTTTLSDAVPGGTWTSGSLIASVDPAWGLVTGVTYGVATISYILPDGCRSTTIVTVNPLPANITGANTVCVGSVTTLNSATTGGTWSSSDVTTASPTVVTGYLSGIAVGSVTITYKLSTGCYKTKAMTVNPLPAAIAGTGPVCAGSTVTLTDSLLGGSWSSGNLAVAAVGSLSGAVMGVSGGTAVITYKLITTGCQQLKIITVNPVPASITGPANICVGSTSFLANAIAGGSWSSSDASIATVDPTGYVSGLVAGSATITYTMPTGCYRTLTVTVHPLPGAITGTTTVCPGATTTLGNTISGGTWTSSTPSVAAIGFSTGIVTGMTAGTTTITYALATGCIATTMVSVHIVPAPIGGAAEMCVGNSTTLSDISVGGTWISTSTVVASIGSASGIVTGVAAGTTTISYMQPSGCARTRIVTINPLPTPIEGELNTCISATTVLSDSMTGGAWSSSNPVVATAGPGTGVITGLTAGTTTITYTLTTGCRTTAEVTIHPTPAPITGMAGMCAGSTITLADATPGGIWSSAYPSIAVVNPTTGVVTGMATGIVTITYTIPENCRIFSHVTVNLSPGPITGSPGVCVGSTTDLNNYVPGGIWTSSNTTVATIGSASGLVSGLTVGTSAITYTIAGCMNSEVVTVNLAPGVITGPSQVCLGAKMTLANSVPGGVWSSSSGAIASISSSGEVTGIFTGIAIITYTIGLDCIATDTIHVAVSPPYADIVTHPKDSTMCVNTMFQNFGTYYPQPAGVTYTWSTTNAQIYQQSPDNQFLLVNYRHPGVAVVKLSTSLSSTGCVLTDSFVVHVGTDTSADHEVSYYNEKLICSDNTADAYQWGYDNNSNFDSTALPYGIHQDYNLPAPDFANNAYWVITTHGDCRQKSYYNMPTGVKSVNSTTNLDIKLFPNPADAKVNIEVVDANYRDNIAVRLTDITGKEISSTILKNGKATIDVSNLPAGTYLVALYKEGTKIGSRIVTRN
jgi:uncharacterized protein YjdB